MKVLSVLGLVAGCLALGAELRQDSEYLLSQNENNGIDDAQYEHFSHSKFPGYKLRIKSPELCDPGVKQYSGYLDVSEHKHLFFWFFEARKNPSSAPVVVWLNGGPGCSSSVGLFMALGPCVVVRDGDGLGTSLNAWSWNANAHMLFIDQPAGVGYSHNSGPIVDNSFTAAEDMWAFLQLFYGRFGEYAGELHIAGESYGGTYVPHIARAIYEHNQKRGEDLVKLNLTSILIGNGFTDPYYQFGALYEWLCDGKWKVWDKHGEECRKLARDVGTCQRLVRSCQDFDTDIVCGTAGAFCFANEIDIIGRSGLNPNDARMKCEEEDSIDCYPSSRWVVEYLNRQDVKRELGVPPHIAFNMCNQVVHERFVKSGDAARSSAGLLPEMIEDGLRMLIYVGDADLLCPGIGQIPWLENLNTTLQQKFKEAPRTDFRTHNRTAGFVRSTSEGKDAGRITYLEIYEAGHMAPHDQPEAALDMFNRWIWNKSLTEER